MSFTDNAFEGCPQQPGDRVLVKSPGHYLDGDIAIVRIVNLQSTFVSVTMQDDSSVHALFHIGKVEKLA